MNWWLLLMAGTVPASAAFVAGVLYGRRRVRNRYAAQYGVARAELDERERHRAVAELRACHKVDLCPAPVGCRETAKIGMN